MPNGLVYRRDLSFGDVLQLIRVVCGVTGVAGAARPCPSCGVLHTPGPCADAYDCDELGIDEDDYPWL